MKVRVLPAGDAAVLVEVGRLEIGPLEMSPPVMSPLEMGEVDSARVGGGAIDAVLALTAALRSADLAGVIDLVPAASTVLVQGIGGIDLAALGSAVRDVAAHADVSAPDAGVDRELLIPVRYDGPDLADVARLIGSSPADVVARHTRTPWRAAFVGFAPGFGYLAGGDPGLVVPRRAESRTAVPAGSVALAGGYSAVYPRASPGGWQLIGSTEAELWNVEQDPPAAIRPGRRVRFVDVTESGAAPAGLGDRS